jgi:hypothetical protein
MDEAPEEELDAVDQVVRGAAQATATWQQALRREPVQGSVEDAAPLVRYRSVAGQRALSALALRRVPSHELAWLDALRRWVSALTVLRVTEAQRAAVARVESEVSVRVQLETVQETTFRSAWKGLLRSKSHTEASAWLRGLAERGPAVAAVRRVQAEREEEAVRRLGFTTWANPVEGASPDALDAAGLSFLDETRDLSRALRGEAERRGDRGAETFVGALLGAVARDAPEGWPACLTLRTLVDTLGMPENVGRGLRVRATMPDVLGAASFSRALESFAVAYRQAAAAASSLPFALAVDPCFVDAHRFGFAFGALPMTVAYQRRGLGLSARVAVGQARTLAKTSLAHARGVALASLLSRSASRPDRARFEELACDVYGDGVPQDLCGAFPRGRGGEQVRLHALLTTLPFLNDLRDHFDEDWFRSPHAWRFLRVRASGPARVGDDRVAPVALARAFEAALA